MSLRFVFSTAFAPHAAFPIGIPSVCVIAGDIAPVDVICHLPVLCEEASVPYVFTPRKEELGAASRTKRPTSVVLVTAGKDKALSAEVREELTACAAEVAGLRS